MNRSLLTGIIVSSIVMVLFSAYTITFEYYPLLSAGRAYEKGSYDDAVKKYAFALFMHRDSDILNFNMGAALYKKGDYQKAAEFFSKATNSEDADLSQKSLYNIGNCNYQSGLKEKDRNEAARFYRKSLDHYSKAISLNKYDEDAKYNKEFVEKILNTTVNGMRTEDRQKPESDDQRGGDNKEQRSPHGQNDSAGGKKAGNETVKRKEMPDDLKGKGSEKGKGMGQIQFKKGEMSRGDAEMLLEEFRKKEQAGLIPSDKAQQVQYPVVEKDW